MADQETVRIEVAFDGGQTISLTVSAKDAAALESALEQGRSDALSVDAETGRYTIALRRIVYAKRIAR